MTALRVLLFGLSGCTAPAPAPTADLAGSKPIGTDGIPAESIPTQPPFPAWTTATPLTLVAPGGENLGSLDRVGVRVQVLQIRPGRVHAACTACEDKLRDAEGYLPKNVLWVMPDPGEETPTTADDPLTLLMAHRARWAQGLDLPAGSTSRAMCWLADHGIAVDGSTATSDSGGGTLLLQRIGASWRLTEATAPTTVPEGWTCHPG